MPFDDIILSGLLGKGSYGNVYFGIWQKSSDCAMEVAVKVGAHPLPRVPVAISPEAVSLLRAMDICSPAIASFQCRSLWQFVRW